MAGTVTALRFQKRNPERVNVFVDGEFALALPALAAAGLKPGQFLTDKELAALQAVDEQARAYSKALRFLAHRPRSEAEIRQNLQKNGYADASIDHAVEQLHRAGYLDDVAFARFWVSDRDRFSPRGPLALRHELRQKGVSNRIIEEALESLESEDSAYRAGIARVRRLTTLEEPVFRQKLGSHLLRRGFPHDVVWTVVDRIWREVNGVTGD